MNIFLTTSRFFSQALKNFLILSIEKRSKTDEPYFSANRGKNKERSGIQRAINSLISQEYSNKKFILGDGKINDALVRITEEYREYFDAAIIEKDLGQVMP